jgi:hypothetical protein
VLPRGIWLWIAGIDHFGRWPGEADLRDFLGKLFFVGSCSSPKYLGVAEAIWAVNVIQMHNDRCRCTLGLAPILERFANMQWLADHYTPEQAAAFVLDRFKRRIAAELEMIELSVESG